MIRELAEYERDVEQTPATALPASLAAVCRQNGYERFEWWGLAWNEPAIDFYKSPGAELLDEWTVRRLSGEPLRELAAHIPAVLNQTPAP
jgi:hypothetical protein